MNCPTCKVALNQAEWQGVELDYCPQCRGVWLDRGELGQIIARSEQGRSAREAQEPFPQDEYRHRYFGRRKPPFAGEGIDLS